ncbi:MULTISPECIES: PTS sugar transporter subunit IIC [unclassified Lactobacillus]|uniref:PTS sugar transporter subunit IIC n=1 Tax=unclassified Lactobacillus TaxID=2620435 RepID=UPI000EFD6068|nr:MULTISPECIES: PTS transporter subunit EIIC [unclassified Lactobacillus]RMC24913.1 PTS sugar transporter subunit IIC [Lactobacillus sp. ESL0247]RMC29068.1 PTS sugar transporter subunit IIC [Lactobacillus sp. ESL0246]RMC32671.1 PTS sugar transporter subunit IIC [Lactobacillus sp. ESL0245]RMC49574.1 PTS sugar transporter subunit IIC [Lactobacillus sp. ESL0228]
MSRILTWLEDYLLPIANKLGQAHWIVALRDAFISVMPITIAGSIAVLIKSLIAVAKNNLNWPTFVWIMQPLSLICNVVWRGTFALFALFLAMSLGYHLAKSLEVDPIAGAIVSLSSFAMSIANLTKLSVNGKVIPVHQAFNISQFSTTGIFTAILFGSLGVAIFAGCFKARLTLHISATLPQAEQQAFDSLIPVIIAIFLVGVINFVFQTITGTYFGNWLLHSIQTPLVKFGQGFVMVMLVTFLVQVFGFFGINGLSVWAPILDSIWLTAQNINVTAVRNGKEAPFLWVRGSFDVFAWFGGTGGTLMLVVAILLFSKRSDYRTIAKVALAPGIFNINEPIVLGLPVVLNPVYFVPFIVAPLVNVAFAYWISILGLVNPVQVAVPAIVPPIIGPFLACNYDWRAIVLSIINMLIALAIWTPFVFAADKIADASNPTPYFTRQY